VEVVVEKELEDVSRPSRSTVGDASFQATPSVERGVEIVNADTTSDRAWFKIGRDYAFEQEILSRIRRCK
jgi:hypothetical protein